MQNLQGQENATKEPPGGTGPDYLPTLKESHVQNSEWIDSQMSDHKNNTDDHKKGVTETLIPGITGQLDCFQQEV